MTQILLYIFIKLEQSLIESSGHYLAAGGGGGGLSGAAGWAGVGEPLSDGCSGLAGGGAAGGCPSGMGAGVATGVSVAGAEVGLGPAVEESGVLAGASGNPDVGPASGGPAGVLGSLDGDSGAALVLLDGLGSSGLAKDVPLVLGTITKATSLKN